MKRTIKFEYPWPCWTNCDPECWDDITMLDITFMTTVHYFKNHSSGFKQFLIKILGFGIRIEWKEYKND